MTKVELLKEFAKDWFGNSQQHSIHAQLLKQRGFGKLGDKIMAESDEEWEKDNLKADVHDEAASAFCKMEGANMSAAVSYYSRSGNTRAVAEAGIPVVSEAFYVKNKPGEAQLKDAADFARKYL